MESSTLGAPGPARSVFSKARQIAHRGRTGFSENVALLGINIGVQYPICDRWCKSAARRWIAVVESLGLALPESERLSAFKLIFRYIAQSTIIDPILVSSDFRPGCL